MKNSGVAAKSVHLVNESQWPNQRDVRFGSIADIPVAHHYVGLVPKTDIGMTNSIVRFCIANVREAANVSVLRLLSLSSNSRNSIDYGSRSFMEVRCVNVRVAFRCGAH